MPFFSISIVRRHLESLFFAALRIEIEWLFPLYPFLFDHALTASVRIIAFASIEYIFPSTSLLSFDESIFLSTFVDASIPYFLSRRLESETSSETHAPVERFRRGNNPSGNGFMGLMTVAKSSDLASFAERLGRGEPSGNGPSGSTSSETQASVERLGRGGNPSGNRPLESMTVFFPLRSRGSAAIRLSAIEPSIADQGC